MHIKMSESIDKLAPALVKAINAIEGVAKDKKAGGGGKVYKYADLSSCLEAAREAFTPNGLAVMQPPLTSVNERGGPYQIVSTMILHESGQWMSCEILVPMGDSEHMAPAQAIGSMITYMRRYSLCAMLSIPMEDDDGAATASYPARRQESDDRRPVSNGNGSYQQRQATPARGYDGPANRIADTASRQPPARTAPDRPATSLDGVPIDDSFGEAPPPSRR